MSSPRPSFEEFCEAVQRRLRDPSLISARYRGRSLFSPGLAYGRHSGPASPDARLAAVTLLIEPRAGQWTIPLTRRPRNLPDHPGQISLPGGRLEAGEDALAAARREFAEEMGSPLTAEILGELLPIYVFNSNYFVHPFVAVARACLTYQPCAYEVDQVVYLPLEQLRDVDRHRESTFSRQLVNWRARVICCGDNEVWGATAILLGELAVVLDGLSLPDCPVSSDTDHI